MLPRVDDPQPPVRYFSHGRSGVFGPWPTMAGAWNIDGCKGINPELHLDSTKAR